MKNDFAAKLAYMKRDLINTGIRHGEQYTLDCVEIYLHEQGWGYDRIKRMLDGVTAISDKFSPAMHKGMEQDIWQERMDAILRDIVKDRQEFIPFAERYPLVDTVGYERLPR